LALFDVAVGGEVAAGGAPGYEVLSRKEGKGSRVVVVREVYFGQPKGVLVAV
jgi:hypothetical protein